MANKKLYTVPISKERFIETVHSLGWSIRDLGKNTYIDRTEKTIRRCLNNGEISPYLLSKIASVMNIKEDLLYELVSPF